MIYKKIYRCHHRDHHQERSILIRLKYLWPCRLPLRPTDPLLSLVGSCHNWRQESPPNPFFKIFKFRTYTFSLNVLEKTYLE